MSLFVYEYFYTSTTALAIMLVIYRLVTLIEPSAGKPPSFKWGMRAPFLVGRVKDGILLILYSLCAIL